MEINLGVLGQQQVESTSGTKKMRLSEHAQSMVFQLFTKNVYSNPIGTVVREITSNCFDSHVEAGVDTPVVIKLSHDSQTDTHYVSFIDYGVGMSPDRVENVYGVYFESTKRKTNNEIGGFGIGGKTPLAYKRSTGEGEGEYDNSFFVITNHDGTKYYYNVYEGAESPEWSLFHKENTDERNGTEIRVPVLQRDIRKFAEEIGRQLYYFENIVFEGWEEYENYVENDYQIVRGKNFLHRGTKFEAMHVCLGRVYYPINFDVLGLREYDYRIPVAINVPIGKIGVTVSREQLDYSETTVTFLKKKIEEVMSELKTMLSKQYEDIITLEDYFQVKNDFGKLFLTDDKYLNVRGLLSAKDIDYSKFKYNAFKTPGSGELFKLFFNVTTYGKRENKGWRNDGLPVFNKDWSGLIDNSITNVYYRDDAEGKQKRMKNAYLRAKHQRYYMIVRRSFAFDMRMVSEMSNVAFTDMTAMQNSPTYKMLLEMQDEYFEIVQKYAHDYEDVVVPDDFTLSYKEKQKMTTAEKNATIPVKFANEYSKYRTKVKDIVDFKGIIFYGNSEEEGKVKKAYELFCLAFNRRDKITETRGYRSGDIITKDRGAMFISVAKNNLKYFQYCRNAHHVDQFFWKMLHRKVDKIMENKRNADLYAMFNNLDSFYTSDLFTDIAPQWAAKVDEVKNFVGMLGKVNLDLTYHENYLRQYIDLDKIEQTAEEKRIRKVMDKLIGLELKNQNVLKFIEMPYRYDRQSDEDAKTLKSILKKVLSL